MTVTNTRNPLDPRTLEMSWKLPIMDSINTPPTNPKNGDRYRIVSPATGLWENKENQIAIYDESKTEWFYETYGEGSVLYDLGANDYRYVKEDGSWQQFDKLVLAISDVTGLQTILDSKKDSPVIISDIATLQNTLDSKEPLLPSKIGNAGLFIKVNIGENGFEYGVGGSGGIDPDTVTDTEIAEHTSSKITITNKSQLNSALVYLDGANEPTVDNTGILGTATKRLASVRAVLIQSGDIILSDKKTGKALYIIDEDKEGITFQTIKGKKMMKILKNGDLLVSGKIREGVTL